MQTGNKQKNIYDIVKSYFEENLIFDNIINVNKICKIVNLQNDICFINGSKHNDMQNSMYAEIYGKYLTIRCKHPECFGITYPQESILLNDVELNIIHELYNNDNRTAMINKLYNNDLELIKLISHSLNGEPYAVAKVVYYVNNAQYNLGENNNWYVYENHKWNNNGPENLLLRNSIQHKLSSLYETLLNFYKTYDYDLYQIKSLKNIIKSLDNTALRNNIMLESRELFRINNNRNNNFVAKLDTNEYIIGFHNGVYDLLKMEFRPGKSDDYISMSVGYNYRETYSEKHNELLKFLENIQPNKEERDYMLTYLSIALIGNKLELFTILTGIGRNGKSKLVELLGKTFGEYYGSVQSQLFTRPRPDANSPDPGLLSLAKKRLIIASEPEKNNKLNSGFIKFITGRDTMTLRNCHSNNMINFTANFITLLICNDIPECDQMDNSFSKRLRCIHFPTIFTDKPKRENEKQIDVNINKNFDFWKMDFMLLLMEYYKNYCKTFALKPTENILKWTKQYEEETDVYLQFLNECTEDNEDGHIHCTTLHNAFIKFFKDNYNTNRNSGYKEFINGIKKYTEIVRVRVGEKCALGVKKLKLIKQKNDFESNESKIHKDAKEKCKNLFSNNYDVQLEYPLMYFAKTNSIDTILDTINNDYSFDKCIEQGYFPLAILDLVCIKNNKIEFGIEIKYTHKVDDEKITKIKEMNGKCNNQIKIYEIDADIVLNNNINNINNKNFFGII